ncbi:MAG: sulfatase [Bryobacteraceae bacterium]|nr:sulfatase [Bryobacteraceae bacterium]
MNRRQFLTGSAAAAVSMGRGVAEQPPNIILILADDQGYGDLGCYGSPHIRTPNIDRMAREGARFTDFYAQPMCGPSRAAILTGCYPVRNSLMFNHIPRARTGIHPNEVTMAELLKHRGYSTMIVGKWHLGDAPPFRPMRHGFDEWFGLPYSNDMWPYHPKVRTPEPEHPRLTAARKRAEMTGYDGQGQTYPANWFPDLPLMSNDEVVELNPDQSRLTERYCDAALGFIRRNRAKPFFLYLAHSMPHAPLFAGKQFEGRSLRGRYGDAVEEIDASTGRIVSLLKELGLSGRTLVIYTSDNGPWAPYGIDAGSAGPLRGAKGSTLEGGMRVPMVAWWPGRIAAGNVTSEVAASIDFLPTFGKLAGAGPPKQGAIDGRDIWPLMSQPGAHSPHDAFYYFEGSIQYRADQGRPRNLVNLRAIRKGKWKLHLAGQDEALTGTELYDLYQDAGEAKNVMASNGEVKRQLEAMARNFDAEFRKEIRPLGTL